MINNQSKQTKCLRFTVMGFLGIITLIFEFTNVQLPQLQTPLMNEFSLTMLQYESIYSSQSLLNIICFVVFGIVFIKIGETKSLMIVTVVYFTLEMLTIYVLREKWFSLLVIIKAIQLLLIKLIAAIWFKQSSLSFAYTLVYCFQKVGQFLSSVGTPYLYGIYQFTWKTMLPSLFLIFLTVIISCIIYFLNQQSDPTFNIESENLTEEELQILVQSQQQDYVKAIENLQIKQIFELDKRFWYLSFCGFFFYVSTNSFFKVANDLLQKQFYLDYQQAGLVSGISSFIGTVLPLVYAYIADKYNNKIYLLSIGNISHAIGFILLIILPFFGFYGYYSIFGIIFIANGTSSGTATIWPLYPIIVERHILGLAFGVEQTMLNISYMINPLLCGAIYDYIYSFDKIYAYPAMLLYITLLSVPEQVFIYFFQKSVVLYQQTNIATNPISNKIEEF